MTKMDSTEEFHQAADAYFASRFDDELVELMNKTEAGDEDAEGEIWNMPLSVELLAHRPNRTCQWEILIGTGGPADRVIVDTDEDGEVVGAEYQYQDWFEAWYAPKQDRQLVGRFARFFYFECIYCAQDNAR